MGSLSSVGITEANTICSIFAAAAPLLVGALASQAVGWRMAIPGCRWDFLVLGVWLWLSTREAQQKQIVIPIEAEAQASGKLPGRYWLIWFAMMFGIAIEFCTVYWSADFNAKVLGLAQNTATQAVSLFLVGMILRRFCRLTAHRALVSAQNAVDFINLGNSRVCCLLVRGTDRPEPGGAFYHGFRRGEFLYDVAAARAQSCGQPKAVGGRTRHALASGVAIFFLPFGKNAGRWARHP